MVLVVSEFDAEEIEGVGVREAVECSCSYAWARASSVGVSVSEEVRVERGRNIGGRSVGEDVV